MGHKSSRFMGDFGGKRYFLPMALLCALGLASCSGPAQTPHNKFSTRVVAEGQPIPKGGGIYKVGTPYEIDGEWYYPKENKTYDKIGIASWYGAKFHGRRTSNGEIYDMDALTAAHPTLPMPIYAKVTNLINGRSLIVRINDRGPYKKNRIIDLSRRSANLLGFRHRGTTRVRVKYLGRAPLNGDDSLERKYLASRPWRKWASKGRRVQVSSRAKTVTESVTWTSATSAKVTKSDFLGHKKPKSPSKTFYVQAGVLEDIKNAERLKEALVELGSVELNRTEDEESVVYYVNIGPFKDRKKADHVLDRIVNAGLTDAKIVLK